MAQGSAAPMIGGPHSGRIKLGRDDMGSLYLPLVVGGAEVMALIDSGSTVSVIHPSVLARVQDNGTAVLYGSKCQLRMADGGILDSAGSVRLRLGVTDGVHVEHELVVAPVDAPLVIGLDFLRVHGCTLDLGHSTLTLGGTSHKCRIIKEMPRVFKITMAETVVVPPSCEMVVPGEVSGKPHFTHGIVEPRDYPICHGNIAMSKLIVNPTKSSLPLRVANLSPEPQVLHKGMQVAICEEIGSVGKPWSPPTPGNEEEHRRQAAPDVTKTEDVDYPGKASARAGVAKLSDELAQMLKGSPKSMDSDQYERACQVLSEFADDFAGDTGKLSSTDVVTHSITMSSPGYVKLPPHRVPLAKLPALKEELQRMTEAGIIEPSCSPWSSPLVLATKKDGSLRICVDFRQVNKMTVKDSYPLPRIDDSIDALRGSKWFSSLDLKSGFWQVRMAPEDVEKTAFSSPFGHYQFRTMPFGLVNAPSTFQKLMDLVLAGLHWEICLIYLDDIIIFSTTFDEHVERIRQVLTRLHKANLKLNPLKCHLFQSRVECLGHIISEEGVATDPKKVEAVSNWPRPRVVKDVRSFLGTCSYYRRFVRGFAELAAPLYNLLHDDVPFAWDEDCEKSFNSLKSALISPPILGFPSEDAEFILDTDASGVGIGAVLSQVQNGIERVIAYFSRSMSPAERRYCVTRRELLAVLCAVKHFHIYLYGRHFLVRSDHGSLQWLLNFKKPEGQLARWLEVLFTYDFRIEHRRGELHGNADGLSRRSCEQCSYCEKREKEDTVEESGCPGHSVCTLRLDKCPLEAEWLQSVSSQEIRDWQMEDSPIRQVIQWLEAGRKPPWKEVAPEGYVVRTLWACFERFEMVEGVVYHADVKEGSATSGLRLVAPTKVRDGIFDSLHMRRTGGHLGIKKTLESVRRRFWWPGMKKDVVRWIAFCEKCQKRKPRAGGRRVPLHQEPVGVPLERVAFDILSFPVDTERGNCCVLVISDYFTKWTEAFALRDHKAITVAEVLVTEFFLRYGVPRFLHSDQAPEFMSEVMRELCTLLEIQRTRSCPYRPQSDGLVERFNRTLIDMLAKLCSDNRDDWDDHLPYVMAAYRSSVNESSGCSPNLLMFGREVTFPIDLIYPSLDRPLYTCHTDYVRWVQGALQDSFDRVRDNLKVAAQRQKKVYDGRAKDHEFSEGEWVLRFYTPNTHHKLASPYVGPYLVIKRLGPVTYLIQRDAQSKPIAVHADHLKCFNSTAPPTNWLVQDPGELRPGHVIEQEEVVDGVTGSESLEEDVVGDGEPVPSPNLDSQILVDNIHRRSKRNRKSPRHLSDFDCS